MTDKTDERFTLINAEDRLAENPETFWIPWRAEREGLAPGAVVKLMFQFPEHVERAWVQITERQANGRYHGVLANELAAGVERGTPVEFGPEHVVLIYAEG